MNGGSKVDRKTACVWWRVSTEDQREISPETQTREALALAKSDGFHVPREYILGTDWGSLSVWHRSGQKTGEPPRYVRKTFTL